MSEQVQEMDKLIYHPEIIELSHRANCLTCQHAFVAMSMIIDLSKEKK